MARATTALVPFVLFVVSAPVFAQASGASTAEPLAQAAEERTSAPAREARSTSGGASLEERRLYQLRQLEARLSVGQALTDEETRLLALVSRRGETPRARALAAAILAWLPPEQSAAPLLLASDDEDALVREQAMLGLAALGRRLPPELVERALTVATTRLDDGSLEVACTAARVLVGLDDTRAALEIGTRAREADDARYTCWRRVVMLPARALSLPPPSYVEEVTPDEGVAESTPPPGDEPPLVAPPAKMPPSGNALFVATATATGFLAGALVPSLAWPPRDTLVYTPGRTQHAREQPSLVLSGATGVLGALLTGGAAFALTSWLDPLEVPAATSTVVGVASGAFAGLGAGLTFGLDGGATGASAIGGALVGLTLSSALAFTLPPQPNDIGLALGIGGNGALLTTLLTLAAVPMATTTVLGDSTRVDFALGTGLLAGGVLTTGGLLLAPLVDVAPGRVLAATAAGVSAAGLGLGLTYLFTPVSVDVRERIASGVGAGLHLLVTTATFAFLPASWVDAIAPRGSAPATTAVSFDEGALRLGLPLVRVMPTADGRVIASLPLVGGRF